MSLAACKCLKYTISKARLWSFFEPREGVTWQHCDDVARALVGGPITPCPIQGDWSYAVYAGQHRDKVIQFRVDNLDDQILRQAQSIFGNLVAKTVRHGFIEPLSKSENCQPKLEILESERITGNTLITATLQLSVQDLYAWRSNLVADFAKFFALSWKRPLHEQALEATREKNTQDLRLLSTSLPPRSSSLIERLANSIDDLYSDGYPLVLGHGDLCAMNIIVDEVNGHLIGIIDWIDAKVQPFGLALWGVEHVLGYMDAEGWHYYQPHDQLRKLFWKEYEQDIGSKLTQDTFGRIHLAHQVGIALGYGFLYEGKPEPRPVMEMDKDNIKYLDALLLSDEVVTMQREG